MVTDVDAAAVAFTATAVVASVTFTAAALTSGVTLLSSNTST